MLSAAPKLNTERLILRAHRLQDYADTAAMWADPEVSKFIAPEPATPSESWSRFLRYTGHWQMLGFGYWCVTTHDERFVGEVGFANYKRDIRPALGDTPEAGWVLAPWAHGQGFAAEAMGAALDWADTRFDETVAIFHPAHAVSQRLANRLGYAPSHKAHYMGHDTVVMRRSNPK
ncbi:GNAT family N-acetyltransferase [Neptunicoccus cionae]|uniref:N-acetyltransferase n=1 Tax=Neptunicoccus cionae TaxID=2035344 RepID=A0A916QVQ5_9RHOB|nr:GNAT family N-acetyltransferase [Amylibacter cionae]GGA15028.1 N-acetyltransferase [Amylibacter cionae]